MTVIESQVKDSLVLLYSLTDLLYLKRFCYVLGQPSSVPSAWCQSNC